MTARRAVRWILAVLLLLDGLSAALGVAALVPVVSAEPTSALAMVLLRATGGTLEAVGGWLLLQASPPAPTFARAGVLLTAAYAVVGIGLRLAPTNLDPAFRTPTVIAYCAFALIVVTALSPKP